MATSHRGDRSRTDTAVARVVDYYLQRVAMRSSYSCLDEAGRSVAPQELQARIDGMLRAWRPILLVYWISDTLTLATAAMRTPPFLRLLRSVRVVVDSTLAGRSTARFLNAHGAQYSVLGHSGGAARLSELSDLMRNRRSCAIAVDGGGPYSTVRPGLAAFAASMRAVVVPLAAWSSRAVPITLRSKVRLPLPGGHITVALGAPRVLAAGRSRAVQAESIASFLSELRRNATAAPAGSSRL